jgi:hypothetical protein
VAESDYQRGLRGARFRGDPDEDLDAYEDWRDGQREYEKRRAEEQWEEDWEDELETRRMNRERESRRMRMSPEERAREAEVEADRRKVQEDVDRTAAMAQYLRDRELIRNERRIDAARTFASAQAWAIALGIGGGFVLASLLMITGTVPLNGPGALLFFVIWGLSCAAAMGMLHFMHGTSYKEARQRWEIEAGRDEFEWARFHTLPGTRTLFTYCELRDCKCQHPRMCRVKECDCGRRKGCIAKNCDCGFTPVCSDPKCGCDRPRLATKEYARPIA